MMEVPVYLCAAPHRDISCRDIADFTRSGKPALWQPQVLCKPGMDDLTCVEL